MFIEKGQIYRMIDEKGNLFGYCKVCNIKYSDSVVRVLFDDGKIGLLSFTFFDVFELVTMSNIKEGETVICIESYKDEIKESERYKVLGVEGDKISLKNKYLKYQKRRFKPCLPLVETIVVKPVKHKKPPIGLIPKDIWIESRKQDITSAIIRYVQNDFIVPIEWIEEYNELISKGDKVDE